MADYFEADGGNNNNVTGGAANAAGGPMDGAAQAAAPVANGAGANAVDEMEDTILVSFVLPFPPHFPISSYRLSTHCVLYYRKRCVVY